MRYPQGGGLTAQRRESRERLRLAAAERFAAGYKNALVAKELRVHICSVQRWRKAWSEQGDPGLLSKGPASHPVLSDALFALLEQELARGPEAHGFPDQTWTLARIKTVIGRRFYKSCTPQGVAALLHRHGWSHQVPARRAVERDEHAVQAWVKETWPQAEEPGRRSTLGSSSRTKPGSR